MAYAEKRGKFWRGRYKLPNGHWGSISRDDDGQRFTTERSAERYAEGLEVDVRRKTFINPRDGRTQLADWAEVWLESIDVGPLSEKEYRGRLRSVILPEWGAVAVGDITTVAFSTWEKKLRQQYKPNYVKAVASVMRTMLEDAVTSKVIGSNPIPTHKSRRRGKHKPRVKDEVVIATPRQALLVARNAEQIRGLAGYTMVLTIAYAAMRMGEVAGLKRDHVMLDDIGAGPRILLQKQNQYVDGKPTQIDPKYSSDRSLILPAFLAELLRQVLASHKSEFVFTSATGCQLLPSGQWYRYDWRPVVDGRAAIARRRGHAPRPGMRPVLGVEGMTPHGLRHSHKVWLDEAGHPRVAVEERMGHVLPGVEGTYSHTTLGMELKIAQSLQELFEQSLRPVVDRREYGVVPSESPTEDS